jgi:cytochrome c oxidase assembly factor CtaG
VLILVALDSPVDTLARQLFWMHMTQHLVLIVVAAPLVVASAPGMKIWRGLPLAIRRQVALIVLRHGSFAPVRRAFNLVARPAPAFVLSTVNLWAWHLPWAYDLTLQNHLVHHFEHALFFGLGLLFWAQVIDQPPFRVRMTSLQRAGYVFAATVQSWVLAGILAMAGTAFYAYAQLPWRPGGISAETDQVIGAGIMWVPGSVTYAIAFIAFLFYWLEEEERAVAVSPRSRKA